MLETLELKHLAPYLPYDLECKSDNGNVGKLDSLNTEVDDFTGMKPILHPLSDLTKEMEYNGEKFVPFKKILFSINNEDENRPDLRVRIWIKEPQNMPFFVIQKLFEWHFDVFGLIDKGLAIDINTLKN